MLKYKPIRPGDRLTATKGRKLIAISRDFLGDDGETRWVMTVAPYEWPTDYFNGEPLGNPSFNCVRLSEIELVIGFLDDVQAAVQEIVKP